MRLSSFGILVLSFLFVMLGFASRLVHAEFPGWQGMRVIEQKGRPSLLRAADLDGDGREELIVVNSRSSRLDIYACREEASEAEPVDAARPNELPLAPDLEHQELQLENIPRDVLVLCVGKSTYARCGLIVNVTPLEPEWRGKVTLEISNTTPLPARVYANEGIAQFIFLKADKVCEQSYADKAGKYQDQSGLTLPRVD